jgi:hypothetical protein
MADHEKKLLRPIGAGSAAGLAKERVTALETATAEPGARALRFARRPLAVISRRQLIGTKQKAREGSICNATDAKFSAKVAKRFSSASFANTSASFALRHLVPLLFLIWGALLLFDKLFLITFQPTLQFY